MHLYYIALIPPTALRQEIRIIQEDFQVRHKVSHSLKSPPHITLQKPFKRDNVQENILISTLTMVATQCSSFAIKLQSFSHFKQTVLYIAIKEPNAIISLATQLQKALIQSIQLNTSEYTYVTQPHITLASRDLNSNTFSKIWKELQEKNYSATCIIDSIYLLKHNGKTWDILHCSNFKK